MSLVSRGRVSHFSSLHGDSRFNGPVALAPGTTRASTMTEVPLGSPARLFGTFVGSPARAPRSQTSLP
jgi:hypothetical protein